MSMGKSIAVNQGLVSWANLTLRSRTTPPSQRRPPPTPTPHCPTHQPSTTSNLNPLQPPPGPSCTLATFPCLTSLKLNKHTTRVHSKVFPHHQLDLQTSKSRATRHQAIRGPQVVAIKDRPWSGMFRRTWCATCRCPTPSTFPPLSNSSPTSKRPLASIFRRSCTITISVLLMEINDHLRYNRNKEGTRNRLQDAVKTSFFRPPLLMWFIVREGALIQGFQESLNL